VSPEPPGTGPGDTETLRKTMGRDDAQINYPASKEMKINFKTIKTI
jgi:hypothetical protein